MTQETTIPLAQELANLYSRDDDVRRVASDAGIPVSHLNLAGSPINDWHNVLQEATRRYRVTSIVNIASQQYPARASELHQALAGYQASTATLTGLTGATAPAQLWIGQHATAILTGVISSLIAAWLLGVLTNSALLQQLIVVPQFALLVLTPFLLRAGLTYINLTVSKVTLIVLSTLFILGEAALFSTLAAGRPLTLPTAEVLQSDIFIGKYLKGEEKCSTGEQLCHNLVKVTGEDIWIDKMEDGDLDKLHIRLSVQWDKRERVPDLFRNYRGTLYYRIDYKCNNRGETPRIEPPELVAYSLGPGRNALSWLIGFVEIPFILIGDQAIQENVEDITEKNGLPCTDHGNTQS